MTSSTILVHFPFPLSPIDSATIVVCYETKIFEIIQSCLIKQKRQSLPAADYSLYIRPQNAILLPFLSVNDYRNAFLLNDQVSFYLIPKMFFTVRLNIISVQVTTVCDGNQTVSNILSQIKNAYQVEKAYPTLQKDNNLSLINISYISEFKQICFVKNRPYSILTSMNEILARNKYKTPVITIKRHNPNPAIKPDNPICPVFNNMLEAALVREKDQPKVPSFLTKIFQLIENNRDIIGIYRKSGDSKNIDLISKKIDSTIDKTQLFPYLEEQPPHDLACIVKQYLRQLTEAIIPYYLSKDFFSVLNIGEAIARRDSMGPALNDVSGDINIDEKMVEFKKNQTQTLPITKQTNLSPGQENSDSIKLDKKLTALKALIRALPEPNYYLLHSLCQHLDKIVEASSKNQMNYKNISICMGTNLVKVAAGLDTVRETADAQSICQLIFENWKQLFENNYSQPLFKPKFPVPKQPLPPAPLAMREELINCKDFRVSRLTTAVMYVQNQPQSQPPQQIYQPQNPNQGQFLNQPQKFQPTINGQQPPPPPPAPAPLQNGNSIFNLNRPSEVGAKLTQGQFVNRPTNNSEPFNINIKPTRLCGFNPLTNNGSQISPTTSESPEATTVTNSNFNIGQRQSKINESSSSSFFPMLNNNNINNNQQLQMQQPVRKGNLKSSSSWNTSALKQSTILVNQGDSVTLVEKDGGKIDGVISPVWIVSYNGSLIRIDSSALEPKIKQKQTQKQESLFEQQEKEYPPIIAPEPAFIAPVNPFGSISLKSLSQRNFLQPDDTASLLAINGPDACHVAEWLRGIESQLDQITDEYKNESRSNDKLAACPKLKKLLRQLSAF